MSITQEIKKIQKIYIYMNNKRIKARQNIDKLNAERVVQGYSRDA